MVLYFLRNLTFKVYTSKIIQSQILNLKNEFLIKGEYYKTSTSIISAKNCIKLPFAWWNRASSVSTSGCVVLYTNEDCNTQKTHEIFSSIRVNYNEAYYSQPNKISNKNFEATR
jgi:hypothetical protein